MMRSKPMPDANIDWTKIQPDMCVTEEGKPRARYFVVQVTPQKHAVAFWGSEDARQAQEFLTQRARTCARRPR